jgi:hypothetical protein
MWAQKTKVTEEKEQIGGGKNNALIVTIIEASADDIEKEFKSLLKDYDAKVSSKDGGLFADNALIKEMGNNPIDIYAKVVKVKDGEHKLIVAFDLGGAFLNSSEHSDKYKVAKQILTKFAIKMQTEAINEQLKQSEKALAKLQDEQKDLEKKNQKMKDDIKEYQEKIKKNEEEIKKNEEDQAKKKNELESQIKTVNSVKDKLKAVD